MCFVVFWEFVLIALSSSHIKAAAVDSRVKAEVRSSDEVGKKVGDKKV